MTRQATAKSVMLLLHFIVAPRREERSAALGDMSAGQRRLVRCATIQSWYREKNKRQSRNGISGALDDFGPPTSRSFFLSFFLFRERSVDSVTSDV